MAAPEADQPDVFSDAASASQFSAFRPGAQLQLAREKALQSDPPFLVVAPTISPPPALDDEHQQTTLERRLDAAILAAGATPPRGIRSAPELLSARRGAFDRFGPHDRLGHLERADRSATRLDADHRSRSGDLVPLRLDPPQPGEHSSPRLSVDVSTKPAPRVLQLTKDAQRSADAVDARPTERSRSFAARVHTNVFRFRGDDPPPRPLPALAALEEEIAPRPRADKVATLNTAARLGIAVRSFSSEDLGDDESPPAVVEVTTPTKTRAAAAVALRGLSDEGVGELGTVDDVVAFGSAADLDELAHQLGIRGSAVPRSDRGEEQLDEISADDIELVAAPADRASVLRGRRPDDDDDDAFDDELEITAPRAVIAAALPASLFRDVAGASAFDDETPARARPALQAPRAVRFIVSAAPARPRHESLSAEDQARNRLRAHDLYLVAMDDLGGRDPEGAIVHLELAVAYDEETTLYADLLDQLKKARA